MVDVPAPAPANNGWSLGHVLAIAGGATLMAAAGPALLAGTALGGVAVGVAGAFGVPIGTGLLAAGGAYLGHIVGKPA